MKKTTLFLLSLFCSFSLVSQHTFSIVAVDRETGEIGSAGATCIAAEDGALAISDIVLGVGAIHTQSFYDTTNQNNARTRMEAGDSPQEIMDWLVDNDVNGNPSFRQYLAVDLNPENTGATFTGVDCFEEFIGVQGDDYAIAGNILISEDVVNDMETAFLETDGSLAEKLMAAMQGAKRPGADERCLTDGISSESAFIRVASPDDTDSSYGNLSLDLNVWITSEIFEPIDELQTLFDEALSIDESSTIVDGVSVYPNPASSLVTVKSVIKTDSIELYNIVGQKMISQPIDGNMATLNVSRLANGVYFVNVMQNGAIVSTQKLIVRK